MSVLKKIAKAIYPNIAKDFLLLRTIIRYRSLKPNKTTLPLGNPLYADWGEPRGRAIIISRARGQSAVKKIWGKIINHYSPEIVIDCGANYGEIVFYTAYPPQSKIYAIEADSKLIPYLESSRMEHVNAKNIQVINAFVGDQNESQMEFFVDKTWSGRSSALSNYKMDSKNIEVRKVRTITIDSLLDTSGYGKTIVFKIDVEGYEPFVFKGMKNILANCSSAIGIIEYNEAFLLKANVDPSDYISQLESKFALYVLGDSAWLKIDGSYQQVKQLVQDKPSDLLLIYPKDNTFEL